MASNTYDSEYGHSAGGVVSLNLKSGSNAYHGSAYWYHRNNALNANETAANAVGTPLSSFRWNQPGLQVEGPVRIPGIYNGGDKTFFMYSWERIRSSIPRVSNMVVPTELERKGDFSQTFVSGYQRRGRSDLRPADNRPDLAWRLFAHRLLRTARFPQTASTRSP